MAQVLRILHLSDRYEIKARLLPGLLCVAVLLPGAAAAGMPFMHTAQHLALGVGFGAVHAGFARNLTGLRSFWLGGALASTDACWWAWSLGTTELRWPLVSSLVAVMAVLASVLLPGYVRTKSKTYADSFVATLATEARRNPSVPAEEGHSG